MKLIDELAAHMLETVKMLASMDPPADSPEGRFLAGIAAAREEYEKAKFPELGGLDV